MRGNNQLLKLKGEQCEKLTQAFVSTFPSENKLAKMLRFRLDRHLNNTTSKGNLESRVFELIEAAESEGWLYISCKIL